FPKSVIEMLRQPLEDGQITISRANGSLTFPAKFILISAQNPCPCGFLNDPVRNCSCSSSSISKYKRKLSGPILDRIDIHVEVPRVEQSKLFNDTASESSETVKKRVSSARKIQELRFRNSKNITNSEMSIAELKKFCSISEESKTLLKDAMTRLSLSARSYSRILKIARTIADLDNSEIIGTQHIAEALQYRSRI
ncbi:ATP-binding protein, partial [Patescibacteria group bacterium]|nr:ATP-binding protein [Patescibacteria group bacterium]